jgi:hypothetical protein
VVYLYGVTMVFNISNGVAIFIFHTSMEPKVGTDIYAQNEMHNNSLQIRAFVHKILSKIFPCLKKK